MEIGTIVCSRTEIAARRRGTAAPELLTSPALRQADDRNKPIVKKNPIKRSGFPQRLNKQLKPRRSPSKAIKVLSSNTQTRTANASLGPGAALSGVFPHPTDAV